MTKNQHKAIRARISGRVQGVGFRYATIIQAKKLSLAGYVRNMPDGSVEVLAEGEPDKLEILIKWLKKGPPPSHVLTMNYSQIPFTGSYGTFHIDY